MTLKFALLGAGRIGQVHAKAISNHKAANLYSVSDPVGEAANAVAAEYNCLVKTIDEVAAEPDVDGVLICTPTNTHADLIEQFSRAGKAVFCEKPIDLDINRVGECLKVVSDENAKLMLGFNRRFDPHFAAAINAVKSGQVGDVEQVVITSRDPGLPPKEYIAVSGGIFRDMTIHDLDIARVLLGEDVKTVQASASALADPSIRELGDYDTATVLLTTASGKQAVITNSRRATYGYDQRIEIHGSLGAVRTKNQRPADIEIASADGYNQPPLHDFFMTRYIEAYANEITAFVDTIENGAVPTPSGEDGLKALILADAAVKAVETGSVITL